MKRTNLMCLIVGILVLAMLLVTSLGCQSSVNEDTGEKEYQVPPKVDATIEGAGAAIEGAGPAIVTGITMFNAVAGGIAGAVFTGLTTLLGLYRKWKKPLVEKGVLIDKMSAGMRAAADVIEHVVKPNKEAWAEYKPKMLKVEAKGAIMPDKI